MINIINIKHGAPDWSDPTNVYIGRGGRGVAGSPLANPFVIGKDGDRDKVIDLYEGWLWDIILHKPQSPQVQELVRILNLEDEYDTVNLACWCKPLPCHGDIIVQCCRYVEKNAP